MLTLTTIPGRPESCENTELWSLAHELWLDVRRTAMCEQGVEGRVTSEAFIEQDEVLVAAYDGDVVGVYAWRMFDLRVAANRNCKMLAAYPDAILDSVADEHDKILVAGHLSVTPTMRRGSAGVSVAARLVEGSVRRLERGTETAILVRTRDNRGMDSLAARYGGVKIGSTVAYGSSATVFLFN